MRVKYALVFCSALLLANLAALGQRVIQASDFGVKANSFKNAALPIQRAIAACKAAGNATLLLPGGRIDVWPEGAEKRELYISNCTEDDTLSKIKTIAFLFDGCNNLTLDGNNTLVVLHGKMVSFALLNCSNVRIKNISFDYERPTMSELTVTSVTATAVETVIHPDSKYTIANGHLQFYGEGWKPDNYHAIVLKPGSNTMLYSSFKPFAEGQAVEKSPLHVRFEGNFGGSQLSPGDVLTVRDPYRDNCGGFINQSRDVALEQVNMYYMHGLGIVSQFSHNVSLFKVVAAPRPNSGRVIASFADCFHFSGCSGLVSIDSCYTSGSHDDPINVHGTHLQITAVDAKGAITVKFMHPQTYGFEGFFAGDSIAFINPQTLTAVGLAKLKTAKLINRREMVLEVDGDMPANIQPGLCIENLTCTPEVLIRNSRFERTNTRGLLITTRRKVVISNNTFFHTGMYPILIADDALSWFESGPVTDVTIANNTFDGCGYNTGSGAINIAPENHTLLPGIAVHRNIRIINNTFKGGYSTVLSARSVQGLVFTGNNITTTGLTANSSVPEAIQLTACKNVQVTGNHFNYKGTPVIHATTMAKDDITTDMPVREKQ
jgi:polygalacturonase